MSSSVAFECGRAILRNVETPKYANGHINKKIDIKSTRLYASVYNNDQVTKMNSKVSDIKCVDRDG
jgi:hypothetical protein